MKTNLFKRVLCLMIPLLTMFNVSLWSDTKTFNSFSGLGSSSYTSDSKTLTPITLSSTGCYGASATELRVKSGSTISVSCSDGYKITKVVFTAASTKYNKLSSPVSWSGTTGTFTNASGVTSQSFSNTAQCRFNSIVVTYESTGGGGGTSYTLVTNAASLSAGDVIVFGSAAGGKVAGELSGTYLTANTATISEGVLTAESALEFTLSKSGANWIFNNSTNQLRASSSSALALTNSGGCETWTISIASNNATITSTTASYGTLYYNSGSPRFRNYTSAQAVLQIYKKGSSCSNSVTIATGSPSNCTISKSAASVSTCGETRQVTISVAPNTCYAAPVKASVTQSGTTATWVSGPTWNGSTSKYDYVYSFAENATGTTTFNCSLSTKTTYTVSYAKGDVPAGGGSISGSQSDGTKTCGTNMTLPGAVFTTTGYTQTGWSKTNGGSQYAAVGGSYTDDAAQTFYPVWTANTISLTLNKNNSDASGSSGGSGSISYYATSGTISTAPTRTGHAVEGYYTDAACTAANKVLTNTGAVVNSTVSGYTTSGKWARTTTPTTLYAKWNVNSYTLTWSWGGGSTSATSGEDYTAAGSVNYGATITKPGSGTMSRNGYTFNGWSTDATTMPADNLTITAQWTANQYTVTLDANGGVDGATTSVNTTFGQAMPTIAAANLPTREGYRFDGFYTGKTDGTKYYNADGTSAKNQARYSDNQVLYAHWVAQLAFSVNGVIDDELTRDDNTAMPSTAIVPTACGDCWAFMGWSTDSDEDEEAEYAGGTTHEFGEPTTLYAVYGKAEYKLINSTSGLVANDNYILTTVSGGLEYAMSNTAQASYTYEIARTDVTSLVRENADGYFLYNVAANNIWKFTGTKDAGQLYNAAADKYLNLSSTAGSSTSMLNTTDNLTFSADGIYWTIHGTKYLHPYGVSGGGWEATSSGSWDADEDFSCYLYHQISAEYATEPSCETYDIVWKVNGTPLASGSQTEETNACAGIEDLPTNPSHNTLECANAFMGWSETELIGEGHDEPADLFTSVGYAPAINEDKTFHAVFATEKTDTRGSYTISSSETNLSGSSDWGAYGTAYEYTADDGSSWVIKAYKTGGNAMQINTGKNSSIKIPDCPTGSFIKSIVVTCTGTNAIGFSDYDYEGSGTINYVAVGSSSTSQTLDLVGKKRTGGYIVPHTNSCAITSIVVNYVQYKDYMTTCCDHIVTLSDGSPSNGSVTFDPVGPIETCTAAKEVSMTITPDPGYYLSAWTSSGVAPSSVEPAVITNTANAQTTTVTFAKETTEGTYTAGATFSAKALEGWTWMYKKDADAADDAVDPYTIPDVVELYKDQYARFIITEYTPTDVIADKQGYVYSAGGVEPAYSTDYLTYVSKNGSAPYSYYQLKGKAPTESTTITFKAVGDASITKTVTIRVKALPTVTFVDLIHNKTDFTNSGDGWTAGTGVLTSTVSTGAVSHAKKTPTHTDVSAPVSGNTCEQGHLHLIGWIRSDYSKVENYLNGIGDVPTMSELTSAGTGYWFDPNADINVETYNGKTFYAVWAKVE